MQIVKFSKCSDAEILFWLLMDVYYNYFGTCLRCFISPLTNDAGQGNKILYHSFSFLRINRDELFVHCYAFLNGNFDLNLYLEIASAARNEVAGDCLLTIITIDLIMVVK